LDCSCLNLVELDSGPGKMNAGDTRPESSQNDGLQQVRIGTVGVQIRGGRSGGEWDEAKIGE
jgi:hypothetical protein